MRHIFLLMSIFFLCANLNSVHSSQLSDYSEIDSLFLPKYKHLIPSRGGSLAKSRVLQNWRLFGLFGKETDQKSDQKCLRFDQIKDPNDFPLTQMAAVTQHLFPSPEGVLAISGRDGFFFKRLGLKSLGELSFKLDEYASSDTGIPRLRKFLEKKTSSNYKKEISRYSVMLIEAVKEAKVTPYSLSPYYINDLLCAYALHLSGGMPAFIDYIEGLQEATIFSEGIFDRNHPSFSRRFTQQNYQAWKSNMQEGMITKEQIIELKMNPSLMFLISEGIKRYEALPLKVNYSRATVRGLNFSNCGEAATLSVFCFLLYDPVTNTLDRTRLPKDSLEETIAFFAVYDPRNHEFFNNVWASLMANLPSNRIRYVNDVEGNRCEMAGSVLNWLQIVGELLRDSSLKDESQGAIFRLQHLAKLFSTPTREIVFSADTPNESTQEIEEFELKVWNEQKVSFSSRPGSTGVEFIDERFHEVPRLAYCDVTDMLELPPYLYESLLPNMGKEHQPWISLHDVEGQARLQGILERGRVADAAKQTLFSVTTDKQFYDLFLCMDLYSSEGKALAIGRIISFKRFQVPQMLPSLNNRLIIDDAAVGVSILDHFVSQGESALRLFPGVLSRIKDHIKLKYYKYLEDTLTGRGMAKHRQLLIDFLFQEEFIPFLFQGLHENENPKTIAMLLQQCDRNNSGWFNSIDSSKFQKTLDTILIKLG